jgi:hypothetical protein
MFCFMLRFFSANIFSSISFSFFLWSFIFYYSRLRYLTFIKSLAFFLVSSIFFQAYNSLSANTRTYLLLFLLKQSNSIGEKLHILLSALSCCPRTHKFLGHTVWITFNTFTFLSVIILIWGTL